MDINNVRETEKICRTAELLKLMGDIHTLCVRNPSLHDEAVALLWKVGQVLVGNREPVGLALPAEVIDSITESIRTSDGWLRDIERSHGRGAKQAMSEEQLLSTIALVRTSLKHALEKIRSHDSAATVVFGGNHA